MNKKPLWNTLASKTQVNKTIAALQKNGIDAAYFKNRADVKKRVFELLPKGAEVMTMSSTTLETLGIIQEVNASGKYASVKSTLIKMNRKTQGREMQKLGAAPAYALGSVHAVTEDGKLIIASNTGSQLPAYAYGSGNVIWVVGTQKIVKNIDEGIKRIYEHSLPLESARVKKAYGMPGSFVSKMLIINRENIAGRLHLLFVNEVLGF